MIEAEKAMPITDMAARAGRRARLRSTMRSGCVSHRRSPSRSSSETRKVSGAAGRIASAGGRRTTLFTAAAAPSTDAAPQATRAPRMCPQLQRRIRSGKRKYSM